MRRLCVFCGSSSGADPAYVAATEALGDLLAAERVGLVYGGAAVGLMGALANAVLAAGGEVVGVIPKGLFAREIDHRGITLLYEVGSMHERKQRMYDLADAFLALPGGFGTLEEVAEVITWNQLGIYSKPVALLDVAGYWSGLFDLFDRAVADGFVRADHRRAIVRVESAHDVLPALRSVELPVVHKWLDLDET
ncbi:MAG: TIGR00730 family Rossman fold protein [Acidimicrobiales bacterium]